ncbi:hypothetical protein N9W17_01180 [Jannaschia sp.]|nr:hypothetical protein [Jannaschia sp.]
MTPATFAKLTATLALPLALAACQPAEPQPEITPEVRDVTNACLVELGQPALAGEVPDGASVVLTQAQQDAFRECVTRRLSAA